MPSTDSNQSDEFVDKIYHREEDINNVSHAITDYLVKSNQLSLPLADQKILGSMFYVVNDIERIGDHAVNIAEWVEYSITGQHRNNEHQDYLNN